MGDSDCSMATSSLLVALVSVLATIGHHCHGDETANKIVATGPSGSLSLRARFAQHQQQVLSVDCETDVAAANKQALDLKLKQDEIALQLVNATNLNLEAKRSYDAVAKKGVQAKRLSFGKEYTALKNERQRLQEQSKQDSVYKEEYVRLYHQLKNMQKLLPAKRFQLEK